jgi:hypothetical protein
MSDQQRVELENLRNERARLEQQWAHLQALRGGNDVAGLFLLIDRTLPAGDLWFDRWELQRADHDREEGAAGAGAAGAPDARLVAVPASARAQMRIVGQARDHGALSRFVRGLYESTEVQDVHLERTMQRRYTTTSIVAFELAILLKGDA